MPPPKDSPLPNPLGTESDYMTDPVHNDTYPAISPLHANLQGRAVFISGASKGLGRILAISYARAGTSRIALGARSDLSEVEEAIGAAAKEAKRPSPEVLKLKFDVTSRESVESAAKEVEEKFGRVDIVINNAGILGKRALLADTDPDAWWNLWTVNLRGPYYVIRSFLPLLLKTEGGSKTIVNVASVGSHLVGPGHGAYQPSKLALLRLGEFAQKEYADQGLISFTVHPGNMVTDILNDIGGVPEAMKHGELAILSDADEEQRKSEAQEISALIMTSIVFVDTPELAADSIVFLTSEKRQWIGGRYVNCTWDMPQLMAMEEEIVKGDKLKVRLVW